MIKANDFVGATLAVTADLEQPTVSWSRAGISRLKSKVFSSGLLAQAAATTGGNEAFNRSAEALRLACGAALIEPVQCVAAKDTLRSRYRAGVVDRTIAGNIGDSQELIGGPGSDALDTVLLENSLAELKSDIDTDQADRLMNFVASRPNAASLKAYLEHRLSTLNFSIAALKGPVTAAFPAFAAQQLDERITPIFVTTDGDSLFGLDLKDALATIESVSVVPSESNARVIVRVRQLALEIIALPAETETVRYAQYEVNLLAGALLMPNNATYQYEFTRGGLEVEYAFEVTFAQTSKPQTFLLRDRESHKWSKCSGARVVNVFGGAEPASWNANADMARRCGSGGSQETLSDARRNLSAKIAAEIAKKLRSGARDAVSAN